MSKWELTKKKYIFSQETAEEEVKKLLEFYNIDVDVITSTDNRNQFETTLNRLVDAYRLGKLENKMTDEGSFTIIQHLSTGENVVYKELQGKHKIGMDNYSSTAINGRMYALIGSITGLGSNAICVLKPTDLSIAECLGLIFFMV